MLGADFAACFFCYRRLPNILHDFSGPTEVEIQAICHGIPRGVSGDNDKRPITTLSPGGPRSSKMSLVGLWTAQDSTLARR